MKTTALAQGTGVPAGASGQERMPADRIAAAKAIAEGKSPIRQKESDTPIDDQVEAAKRSMRTLKMKTNVSPEAILQGIDAAPEPVAETTQSDQNATVDASEPAKPASEETKPLSPQFAALARQKRALQVKERELAEREAKLAQPSMDEYVSKAELLANPLKVFEAGVTYDQLTDAILNNQKNPDVQALLDERLKAERLATEKLFAERDAQMEQQVIAEIQAEAESLVAGSPDDYELVKEQGLLPHVKVLIKKVWDSERKALTAQEALEMLEKQALDDALKVAKLKKVQSQLTPAQKLQQQQQPKGMRTLTNQDTASQALTAKQRAMLAFHGQLRK